MAADQLLDLIDGMTQEERRIQALDPGYIKIDDRKLSDLLKFMADFSGQVNFYNDKNEIDGNWRSFFNSDVNLLVYLITEFDLTSHLAQYERLESRIQLAESDKEVFAGVDELFTYLDGIIKVMGESRDGLMNGTHYNRSAYELAEILKEAQQEAASIKDFREQFRKLVSSAGLDSDAGIYKGSTLRSRVLAGLPHIKDAFRRLRSAYNNFLAITSFHFKDIELTNLQYQPHLALCITFLHLFGYLQDQLNRAPEIHLDFYYKQILGMRLKAARADTVDLIVDPVLKDRVVLKKGEELTAEIDGNLISYSLNDDLLVTRARVADIKTIFLDEHTQVAAPDGDSQDVKEVEVYKASQKNTPPSQFFKQQAGFKSWPIFGESQFELSDEDRSMEDTDLGILLSSPVLYQPEGHRTISVILFFDQTSFIQLLQYFRNFARVTGKQLQTISYELLSDAFIISFSAIKGWEEVQRYSVRTNFAERNIEIEFELSPVDPGVDLYDPAVHGEDYQVAWPVLRLLLNNYSTHNPFSFFRKMVLERVTISASISGNHSLKLQNNVGTLSSDNPFHPFGPQPTVGSFLDIKNTNIFNRYTKDFSVKLEWIDLPREPGGWETYYRDYNLNITNSSFKVKLSAMSHGRFKPTLHKRQEFNLFEMEEAGFGPAYLSDQTEIRGVDLKKLELPNKPLMDREDQISDSNFTEGAIRLEFTAPQEGFGSKVYPQIFPETVIHNSRRFSKKRPLPNPPSIPVVKSISVSYTLEHSEVLIKTTKNEDSALNIIHQYPFGYEHVYPESDKQPYHFIPDFEYENNLYIGIEHLDPEQDITMLFQLKETNFTDTASDPSPVIWSYLYANSWVEFAEGMVLFDSTNNFINTGIVKLRLPEDVTSGNTRLDGRYCWIRASSGRQKNKMSEMIGVYLHAVTATRLASGSSSGYGMIIPPGSIKGFKNKIPGIAGVFQLFSSYGGRPAETAAEYYVRVSERLRHRNRLVTNRDIESALLECFPELLMVKSISPQASFDEISTAKKIRVIIVPRASQDDLLEFEKPRVSLALLYQIKNFVRKAISPFAEVEVENPVYEKIKLLGKIKFHKGHNSDVGLLLQTLNDDLKRYLCPWIFESGSSFKIGSQIYMADLLNYIKRRPYVDYITGFSVIHFYNWEHELTGEVLAGINDFGQNDRDYIKGSVPEAVIVPSEDHMLTVIDEAAYSEPVPVGIGNLLIAEELIVYDEKLTHKTDEFSHETNNPAEIEYIDLLIGHNIISGNG